MFKYKTITKMKVISRVGMSVTALGIALLLLFSYYGQNIGHFSIEVTDELYNNQILLSESYDFNKAYSRLIADPISNTEPIGIRGDPTAIPLEVERAIDSFKGGSNNSSNYFAYTFYLKNDGEKNLAYNVTLRTKDVTRNVDEAIRVMIITELDVGGNRLVDSQVYAKRQGPNGQNPGEPELGTTPFYTPEIVLSYNRLDFRPNTVDKYTIIMWIHGEDIDCIGDGEYSIRGGKLALAKMFSVLN